jgi:hypothetical protein
MTFNELKIWQGRTVVRHLRHGEITTARVDFGDQKIRGRNRDAPDLEPAYEKPPEQEFTIQASNIERADPFRTWGAWHSSLHFRLAGLRPGVD